MCHFWAGEYLEFLKRSFQGKLTGFDKTLTNLCGEIAKGSLALASVSRRLDAKWALISSSRQS